MRLINFKLTRGNAEHITSEQVWAELGRMWFRRMTGETQPTGPAKTNKPAVDVRQLVAEMDDDPCPECGYALIAQPSGGVKCGSCRYWFCY